MITPTFTPSVPMRIIAGWRTMIGAAISETMLTTLIIGFGILATFAGSSSLVAAEVIRAGDPVTSANAVTEEGDPAFGDPLIGREVRRTVYAGKPITYDNRNNFV